MFENIKIFYYRKEGVKKGVKSGGWHVIFMVVGIAKKSGVFLTESREL